MSVDTEFGVIAYYESTSNFVAMCRCHTDEQVHFRCTRTRTSKASKFSRRHFQGRPLGELYAWLSASSQFGQIEHQTDYSPSYEERTAARAQFSQLAGAAVLLARERDRREDEPEEPVLNL